MLRPYRLRTSAICLAGCILLVNVSLAQTSKTAPGSTPSQNILVTVTDENDVAVPSAFVFLQASPQAVALRCVTDIAGHCEFSRLPAATYQLRVEKQGFYSVALPAIQAGAASIDVTLSRQQEVREVVDVVESPPAIDPAQIAAQQTLKRTRCTQHPISRHSRLSQRAEFHSRRRAGRNGQPHVAGAETYQTVTALDGFNITQPANGQLLARISTDAFRSIRSNRHASRLNSARVRAVCSS